MNGLVALTYGVAFGSASLLDRFLDRFGPERIMSAGFIGISVVYLSMAGASESFAGLLSLVFVWGLANHIAFNALIQRLTMIDPSRRGTIMGLNSAVTYIAVVVGTTGFGETYSSFGFAAAGVAAAALSLMAAAAGAWPALRAAAHLEDARKSP
jgi:predicted MFS family arabinose efflux permease